MTRLTILGVDDDPFIREVLGAALHRPPGVTFIGCESAEQALEVVRTAAPDLIVLDVMMPGVSGLQIHARLRCILEPMPPVVYMTAGRDTAQQAELLATGASGIISKPFDPASVATEVLQYVKPRVPAETRDVRLSGVAARFRASLPHTMASLDRDWGDFLRDRDRSCAERFLAEMHKLAGSAGLFKLDEIGAAARIAEQAVHSLLVKQGRGSPGDIDCVDRAMAALRKAAADAAQDGAG